ncbi:hypothetical protein BDQ12DRAFT_614984 [Crucibulum laeve]|uniref:Uncharacterized protein n=1 Tax=Crucibulum laeve TaxID=68775 RepID=A0A5C3LMV9_9AGAR|nr:hypothetical protein BDQ12DRAFT_614984 [Crucibulum laeve]
MTYKSGALIYQERKQLYSETGYAALYAVVETYLENFYWHKVYDQTNDGKVAQQYKLTDTRGTKITQGSETAVKMGISATFEGIGLDFGIESKKFSSVEKSSQTTQEHTLTLVPDETTYFFQRRYNYLTHVWLISDQSGTEAAVGQGSSFNGKSFRTQVLSDEYLTRTDPLSGSTALTDLKNTASKKYNFDTMPKRASGDLVRSARNAANNYLSGF